MIVMLTEQAAELQKLKNQKGTQVAFSVALVTSGSETKGPFSHPTTLIFKHVQTNIRDGYNKHTGVFTAPVKGAYHFEWQIGVHGDDKHPACAVLIKNSEGIFSTYERQKAYFGMASNSVTLLLEVRHSVFLRLCRNSKVFDDVNHYSTFSGHLLFPM
ncbi:complement C1q-like protein 2 [Centropristis striata]|uniref:complement C1q-like protein 2 n=1 Tax=Centropristis striata TaxID=184440 RepID=UPI0027E1B0CF|nr:complement C1q-like protein 2 [Centropristis striata]